MQKQFISLSFQVIQEFEKICIMRWVQGEIHLYPLCVFKRGDSAMQQSATCSPEVFKLSSTYGANHGCNLGVVAVWVAMQQMDRGGWGSTAP